MMYPDFLDLLRVFEKHKVSYAIIGGYAVGIYSEPKFTKAIDIIISPSLRNASAVLKALKEFGAPTENLSCEDLSKPGLLYIFGIPPLRIDILNNIDGLDVSKMIKNSKIIRIKNTKLRIVSLADLIKTKEKAGRPQDKVDLLALRRKKT